MRPALVLLLLVGITGTALADPPRGVRRINGCAIYSGAKCPGANLAGADLRNLDMSRMDLTGANLSGAAIGGTNFFFATLDKTNFDAAHGVAPSFRQAHLTGATLKGALIPSASFSEARMEGANLQGAHVVDGNFEHARLDATMFTAAHLGAASFRHAHFANTHFRDAHVDLVHFWPSNFNADHSAVNSLFVRLSAHINAYGGCCAPARDTCSATKDKQAPIDSDSPQGICQGTGETNGDVPGFGRGDPIDWSWKTDCCTRHLTVTGRSGDISGIANGDWADFHVTSITSFEGIAGHTRHEQPRGLPGGPVSVYLARRDYTMRKYEDFPGAISWTGYVLNLSGWLPRAHTGGL